MKMDAGGSVAGRFAKGTDCSVHFALRATGQSNPSPSRPFSRELPAAGDEAGSVWLEAAVDGVTLWDRQLRVSRFLGRLRRAIVEGRWVRRFLHGQPYWVNGQPLPGRDYVERAGKRLQAVERLLELEAWADVVRESQEIVELSLKGLLRHMRIEPPRVHDVSELIEENRALLPADLRRELDAITEVSRRLRRDRELAFYGSEDLTPSEFYKQSDAREAFAGARLVAVAVERAIGASGQSGQRNG